MKYKKKQRLAANVMKTGKARPSFPCCTQPSSVMLAYENVAIARTETDRSFAAWRDKWGADTDLSADWMAYLRKKVQTVQPDRIARDAADKNRKDA